jgi:hypothetical protein
MKKKIIDRKEDFFLNVHGIREKLLNYQIEFCNYYQRGDIFFMNKIPAIEEINEMLAAKKITQEQAVQILKQRAREINLKGKSIASGANHHGENQSEEVKNDLIIETSKETAKTSFRGSSREIWEYESEKIKPAKELWIILALVIVVLFSGLSFFLYKVFYLFH